LGALERYFYEQKFKKNPKTTLFFRKSSRTALPISSIENKILPIFED
jgi:hypothetical protein